MSRVQLALNVDDLQSSIDFYATLFGAPPAKVRPGYANFALTEPPLKLVLIENPGQGGSLNHLGVEVADVDTVDAEQARLSQHGLATLDERGTTCCYAKQDKFWVEGTPNGERWEVYTVLADSLTFAGQPAPSGSPALPESSEAPAAASTSPGQRPPPPPAAAEPRARPRRGGPGRRGRLRCRDAGPVRSRRSGHRPPCVPDAGRSQLAAGWTTLSLVPGPRKGPVGVLAVGVQVPWGRGRDPGPGCP